VRATNGIHSGCYSRFGHDAAVPNDLDQLVGANDTIPVGNKEFQQIEDLRFDRNQFGAPTQFAAPAIEREISKSTEQFCRPHLYSFSPLLKRKTWKSASEIKGS